MLASTLQAATCERLRVTERQGPEKAVSTSLLVLRVPCYDLQYIAPQSPVRTRTLCTETYPLSNYRETRIVLKEAGGASPRNSRKHPKPILVTRLPKEKV